jgi:hypothetical protein
MKRIVSASELAGIVSRLLSDPQSAGELDEADAFARFMTDIAQVVSDHCGGEIVSPASRTDKGWTVSVTPNDSLPETGGVWGVFETESAGLFEAILDATKVSCNNGPTEDLLVRHELIAQEYLSSFPADLVLTRERIDEDSVFGEALHWMTPHFDVPLWEGRSLSEFLLCYQSGLAPDKANALMLRTDRPNEHGVSGEYVTIEMLRHAAPTGTGTWRLPTGKVLKFS